MRTIVINTGTELLLGDVLNTHLAFIAREILPFGLRVDRQITVPDVFRDGQDAGAYRCCESASPHCRNHCTSDPMASTWSRAGMAWR